MSCNVVNSQGLGQYIYGFPCPYDSVMDPGPALAPLLQATGLSGCGCGCGGGCGMGALTMDGSGLFGSGLFSSAFDISTWGIGEYIALAFGAYLLYAVVGTTKAEAKRASKGYRRIKSRLTRQTNAGPNSWRKMKKAHPSIFKVKYRKQHKRKYSLKRKAA